MRLAFKTVLMGLFALMSTSSNAHAQVIPDAILSNNTTININGTTINIEGGTRLGNNLFHRFREFTVRITNSIHFNHALSYKNNILVILE